MKSNSFALVALLLCSLTANAAPVVRAQSVLSERSKATALVATPRWKAESFPTGMVARLQYGEMSAARILRVERSNATRQSKPTQIGIAREASGESVLRALPTLSWIALKSGGSVARIEIRSPVALGLRVGLKVDALDARAELRFSGSDEPSRVVAMMSGREIRALAGAGNLFWTPATDGEKQFIEVYLPPGVPRAGARLQAPQLSHLLANSRNDFKMIKSIGDSGACNVDTICRVAELGANFVSAKNAVAHMVFVVSGTSYICTGTLLADTLSTSQIPYFYSANHCIDNQTVASTLNTYWKFEATSCGSGVQAARVQLTGGAAYLYSDPDSSGSPGTDGLLLRLNNTPPAGSEFAGWNSAALANDSSVIAIHHPAGDLKKVSSGQQISQDSYNIEVGWLQGTTEGGSSGSGLFTTSAAGYQLRGGLYGGDASCANTGSLANTLNRDYYSRFDVVFPHISQWLSPVSATPIRVNGSQPLIPPHAGAASAASTPAGKRLLSRKPAMGPFEP